MQNQDTNHLSFSTWCWVLLLFSSLLTTVHLPALLAWALLQAPELWMGKAEVYYEHDSILCTYIINSKVPSDQN